VTLHSPDEQDFFGRTLEEVLAWCLVWLMFSELGSGASHSLLIQNYDTGTVSS
jgi:hypothetical protein